MKGLCLFIAGIQIAQTGHPVFGIICVLIAILG